MSKALAEQLLGELSLEQLDLDIFRAHSIRNSATASLAVWCLVRRYLPYRRR